MSEDEFDKILLDSEITLTPKDSLLILSFGLPFTVVRVKNGGFKLEESKSMIYPTIYRLRQQGIQNFKWLGWPGLILDTIEEKIEVTSLLAQENCVPIWIEQDLMVKYQLFVDKHLNPLFHNHRGHDINDVDSVIGDLWKSYQEVN